MYHTHSQGSVEISATLKNGKDLLIQQCLDQSFNKNFHGLLSSKLTFLLGALFGELDPVPRSLYCQGKSWQGKSLAGGTAGKQ